MKAYPMIIDLYPVEQEKLSAAEFAALVQSRPGAIKNSHFVPGILGGKSFGEFSVTYTRPIYKATQGFSAKFK